MKMNILKVFGFAVLMALGANAGAESVAKIGATEYETLKAAIDAAGNGAVIRILKDGVEFNATKIGAIEKDVTLNLNFKRFSFTTDKLDLSKGHLTIAGFGIVSGMIQTTKPEDQTRVFVRSGFFPKMALLPILKQEGNPNGWIDLNTMLSMTRPAYPVTDYSQDGDPVQERFYVEDGFLPKIGDDGKLVIEGSNYSNNHIANSDVPSYNVIPLPKSTITKMTLDEFAKGLAEKGGSIENLDNNCVARMQAMDTPVYAFNSYADDAMQTAFEGLVSLWGGTKFNDLFALAMTTESLTYQEYAMGMCKFSNWFADYSIEFDADVSGDDINSYSPLFVGAYGWGGVQPCRNIPEMEAGQKHYLVKNYMGTQDSFTYCLVTSLASPFLCTTVDMLDDPNDSSKCKQYGKTVTVQLRIQNPDATNFDSNDERESILISQCRYTYGKGVIAKVGNQPFTLAEVNGAIAAGQLVDGMTVKILNDIGAGTKISGINAAINIDGNGFKVADGAFEAAAGYKVVDNGDQTWSVVADPLPPEVAVEIPKEGEIEAKDETGAPIADEKAVEAAKTAVQEIAGNTKAEMTGTGVGEAIVGGDQEVKPSIMTALEAQVDKAEDLTEKQKEDVKKQVNESKNVSSYVNVKVESPVVKVVTVQDEKVATVQALVYDVKPMAVTKVSTTVDAEDPKTVTVIAQIPNEEIKTPITFRLPLTDAFTVSAVVTHEGDPDRLCMVQGEAGGRYVEVTASHFSLFTATPSDIVETTTESKTVLGIKRVDYTVTQTTADLAAAVPWLKAAEANMPVSGLVTTGLSDGDQIQVYEKSANAYYTWLYRDGAWGGATGTPSADEYKLERGRAFWYKPVGGKGASGTYTQVGLYSEAAITSKVDKAAVASASFAKPAHFLMASPKYEDFNLKEKLTADAGCAANDVVVIVATGARYRFNGSVWGQEVDQNVTKFGVSVTQKAFVATEGAISVPAGTAFWYLSAGGAPEFEW